VEELYILSQAGSTPVLSLLGGLSGKTSTAAEPKRPFVNLLFLLTKGLSASAAVEVFPELTTSKDFLP
jgi:hypothetical protein